MSSGFCSWRLRWARPIVLLPVQAAFGTPPLWVIVVVWAVPTAFAAWLFLSEEL
jgi:hypothetical protein